MINLIYIFLAVAFVTIVGGSIGYVVWLKTRPKKETYIARVYQLGEGVIEKLRKDKGEIILKDLNLKLKDLKPFSKDFVERVEKAHGQVVYRLQKANKCIDAIEGGVEIWDPGKKEISVLKIGESYTQIKKSYNEQIGQEIFHPMPHSRINIIMNQIAIRKERLHKEKDILQAITPWVVTGICMIALVCLMYIAISGMVKMSEEANEMADKLVVKEAQILALEKKMDALMGIYKIKKPVTPLGQVRNKTTYVIPMVES